MSKHEKTPDSKLRVGVVGLGMGKSHIPNFARHPHAEVVALCDVNETLLKAQAEERGIKRTFTDAAKLFGSGEVDVVSIATPNATHQPLTLAALEAGLHVCCEKPMAMNAGQSQQMLDKAREKGRKLAINYSHRQKSDVAAMGRYVHAGDVGDVYFIRTTWHRRRGIPGRPSFVKKASAGGGCLIDLGVHIIDIALYLAGFPEVRAVSGQTHLKFADKYAPKLGMEVDDFATAYIRCADQLTIAVEVSWASHHLHPEQMITSVYGTEGGLTRKIEHYRDPLIQLHHTEHENLVSTTVESFAHVPSVQEDLIDAILQDREPAASGAHGHLLMQVLDAIYESSETGKEVAIAGEAM